MSRIQTEALSELGKAIRESREAMGLSLRDVFPKPGSSSHLSRVETGQVPPSLSFLDRIAKRLSWSHETYDRILHLWRGAQAENEDATSIGQSKPRKSLEDQRLLAGLHARIYLGAIDLVRAGLEQLYGADDIENLISTVFPQRPVHRELAVDFQIRDSDSDSSTYLLTTRQDFTASVSEYVIAIISDVHVNEAVLAMCPRISDTWLTGGPTYAERALETRGQYSLVSIRTEDGITLSDKIDLESVAKDSYPAYLGKLSSEYYDQINLLAGDIPHDSQRVVITGTFELPKSGSYCYWMADRPSFVRRITFDVADFSLDGSKPKFHLQPFMASIGTANVQRNEDYFELEVNNWLVKGQGAVLTWTKG